MKTTIIILVKYTVSDYRAAVVNCKSRISSFIGYRFAESKPDSYPTMVINTTLTKEDKDKLQAACLEKDVAVIFVESDKDLHTSDTVKI